MSTVSLTVKLQFYWHLAQITHLPFISQVNICYSYNYTSLISADRNPNNNKLRKPGNDRQWSKLTRNKQCSLHQPEEQYNSDPTFKFFTSKYRRIQSSVAQCNISLRKQPRAKWIWKRIISLFSSISRVSLANEILPSWKSYGSFSISLSRFGRLWKRLFHCDKKIKSLRSSPDYLMNVADIWNHKMIIPFSIKKFDLSILQRL